MGYFETALDNFSKVMVAELTKPDNADLRSKVAGIAEGQSFMYDFEDGLTPNQRKRWRKIVDAADTSGMSGAAFGWGCRQVQAALTDGAQ